MGVFGGFIYGGESVGGDVYGPDVDILTTDLITADVVRIRLESPVVVDDAYRDPTNYTLTVVSGPGQELAVRSVLPIQTNIASDIILVIDKIDKGTIYAISIGSAVISTTGQSVAASTEFTGRSTKTENMVRGLPAHFNTAPDSVICCLLAAIGISDDLIGGSLDDPT